jgi:hypothetical protein
MSIELCLSGEDAHLLEELLDKEGSPFASRIAFYIEEEIRRTYGTKRKTKEQD